MGNNKIIWRNIFYFLSYCHNPLKYLKVDDVNYENVKGFYDLTATLLNVSFSVVEKLGYAKQYEEHEIVTDRPKGRININKSYRTGTVLRGKMVCNVSRLTIDTDANQMIKLAFKLLMKSKEKLNEQTLSRVILNYNKLSKVSDLDLRKASVKRQIKAPEYYAPALELSKIIINDWLLMDKTGTVKMFNLSDNDRIWYIWEEFLRKYIKEYMLEKDREYIVSKETFKFADGESITPDVTVYKDRDDALLRIFDAKWYTKPDMNTQIKYELLAQATKVGVQIKNRDTHVIAVFGYHKDYMPYAKDSLPSEQFKYTMYAYTININKDFELIKKGIEDMLNEQFELETTA